MIWHFQNNIGLPDRSYRWSLPNSMHFNRMVWNHSDTNNCNHRSDDEREHASWIFYNICKLMISISNHMSMYNSTKRVTEWKRGSFGRSLLLIEMDWNLSYWLDAQAHACCTICPPRPSLLCSACILQCNHHSMLFSSNIPSPNDFQLPHPTLRDSNQVLPCGKTGPMPIQLCTGWQRAGLYLKIPKAYMASELFLPAFIC